MTACTSGQCRLVLVVLYACGFVEASSHASHLRASGHVARIRKGLPPPVPLGVAPPSPAAAAIGSRIGDMFAKMDVNKDGKVDVNEFVIAEMSGVLPVAAPGPAPAPALVIAAPPAPAAVPPAAPVAAPVEVLPEHLLKPPPLPEGIPEPPPPPRPPPAEPAPPPLPPMEGQLVGPPPTVESMASLGNLTELQAMVPSLDLDGSDPVQAPNTPPPIPAPLLPPALPKLSGQDQKVPPEELPKELMQPSPVSFGLHAAVTLPVKAVPLSAVNVEDDDPMQMLLESRSSHRKGLRQ